MFANFSVYNGKTWFVLVLKAHSVYNRVIQAALILDGETSFDFIHFNESTQSSVC